jgi:hypothetical protein
LPARINQLCSPTLIDGIMTVADRHPPSTATTEEKTLQQGTSFTGCVFQRIRPPIPAESGRLVQRKPATYSSGIWPPIPAESGRLIHRKPATQSKGKRPPVMAVRSGSFYSYCVSV